MGNRTQEAQVGPQEAQKNAGLKLLFVFLVPVPVLWGKAPPVIISDVLRLKLFDTKGL